MDETQRTGLRGREWLFVVLLAIAAIMLIHGQVTISALQKTNVGLQTKTRQLQGQIDQLKNTSTYLFSQAADSQQAKQYENAINQYQQIVVKYPTTTEASEAKKRIHALEQEIIRQKAVVAADAQRRQSAAEAEARRLRAEEEANRRAYEESIKPPLTLVKAMVTLNSIDNPEGSVIVRNRSRKIVDAYTVAFYCYDRYGDPVNHYANDTNRYGGLCQRTVRPGQTTGDGYIWTLFGHENTAKVKVVLEKVHMTDGSEWTPKSGQEVAVWGFLKK